MSYWSILYLCKEFSNGVIAIGTALLAYFAYKALHSWKVEANAKKRFDLAFRLYEAISTIENLSINIKKNITKESQNNTLISLYASLKAIFLEYEILGKEYDELSYFIDKFSFCENSDENDLNKLAYGMIGFLYSIAEKSFIDPSTKMVTGEAINEERQLFIKNINKIREFCKNEMKGFYKI